MKGLPESFSPQGRREAVYGGVVYFPIHPKADMHGLVRIIIRTKSTAAVHLALNSFCILTSASFWNCLIFQESKSAAEQKATEGHYGEVLVCSLAEAYLKPENYQRIGKGMKNV
jgi:hypothetical protein